MPKTRLAVIGLGMAVAPHARGLIDLADRVEVAACYSQTDARRTAFTETYGLPVSGDLEAIFADETIDAVMILTPPNTHLDLVCRAAAAGKHVLLEKPLEISFQRSVELVETAERAGITLGVVLQNRFRPVSVALKRLIDEERLGAVVSASARLMNWRPQSYYDQPGRGTKARDGGGVLLTQGIHTLDLLISLVGGPSEIFSYAVTSPMHRMETEDLVAAAARWEGGAIGTILATTCAYPGLPDTIDVIGTKGSATLVGSTLAARFQDGTALDVADDQTGGGFGADPMAFSHHHHRAVLADFLDAIEQDRAPRISGREALKVHGLIEAMLESGESGKVERTSPP
jgi:predicted dehydrogenase